MPSTSATAGCDKATGTGVEKVEPHAIVLLLSMFMQPPALETILIKLSLYTVLSDPHKFAVGRCPSMPCIPVQLASDGKPKVCKVSTQPCIPPGMMLMCCDTTDTACAG